ncbi:MAG: PASTA domain-containing protein [Bacteroidales bacterium]
MKKDNWIVRNLVAAAATGVVILILTIIFLKIITRHNQEMEVPDLSGMTIPDALKVAKESNLRLEVTDSVFLPRMGRGVIFRQNPVSGSMVKKNRRILLTINSIQPKRVSMPSIIGYSLRQAKAELTAKQLNVGKLIYVNDMATNNVLSQRFEGRFIPTGTMIETESEIDLELGMSADNSMTSIPSLVGFSLVTAKDIIIDNSLNIGRLTFDESVKNYADTISSFVVRQFPEPTESLSYILGSRVDLVLSTDKTKIDSKNKSL